MLDIRFIILKSVVSNNEYKFQISRIAKNASPFYTLDVQIMIQ